MSLKHRVLFVDDEPAMLTGLSRLLRSLRHEIDSEFAGGGAAALALLAERPFDIVVSDIRMPGMDGAELLQEVQRRYPHIIRIVLSGHADLSVALRAVPVVHQFLAKPCDAAVVREVIRRAANLHKLLQDQRLKTLVAGIRELPARPRIISELMRILDDPGANANAIAALVARDVALSAQVLKVVNSAFFGLARRVTAIESAVSYLGTGMLRALMLSSAATDKLGPRARALGYDLEGTQRHALLCGQLASLFFQDKLRREDAFASGLLHDIGELLLIAESDPNMLVAASEAAQSGRSLHLVESERGFVSHAYVGAYLLGAWGIPYSIVEAVAHHHEPSCVEHEQFDVVDAVYCANLILDYLRERDERLLALAHEHAERLPGARPLSEVVDAAMATMGVGSPDDPATIAE